MRRLVSALLVVAAIGVLGVVVWSFVRDDGSDADVALTKSDAKALSVEDAVNRAPDVAFAVRGYVVDDGAFVQLCQGIQKTRPPRCGGAVVLLRNLDLARLNLERSGKVRYTPEPVILGGRLDGTQLYVLDVVAAGE
jgi:hypothetical protein